MNKYIAIAVIIGLIVIGVIFFGESTGTGNAVKENVKEFTLDATRFQYNPDTITVNNGDRVKIIINNIDTTHGIRIPDFNVQDTRSVEFVADKAGEFDFYCTVMCGQGHPNMKGKIIVK